MHVLGILFLCLVLGAVASLGDVVGAWLFDRRRRQTEATRRPPRGHRHTRRETENPTPEEQEA